MSALDHIKSVGFPVHRIKFNLTGQKFDQLLALGCFRINGITRWLCLCDCGHITFTPSKPLRTGKYSSCRCVSITHGLSGTSTYNIWSGMIQRCSNTNRSHYESYGGRGITVCASWRKFENFLADMGLRPFPKYSIERRNNNSGGYWCGHCVECLENDWPSNCYWAPVEVQARNRRTSRFLEFKDQTKTMAEWCQLFGQDPRRVHARLKAGWTVEDALTLTPSHLPRTRR